MTRPLPMAGIERWTRRLARCTALLVACCGLQAQAQNTAQQLGFAGLRSVAMQGEVNAVRSDGAGNLYLLLDQRDGVRLLKTDATASTVLAQALLGAKGDVGLALALDPAGNLYVTGTSTSTALTATPGAAIAQRTDSSTQSFVANFDANLNTLFVTFTGGSKIAANALAATADAVFVTGVTYAANLPVTANGIEQTPAAGSSGNGFVERFTSSGSTLVYATYLTGANGDTNPAGIAADSNDDAYIVGSTSASGYPTVAAVVPAMLTNPSGFLTKLTPAGDALAFSTFVSGAGLTSVALDAAGTTLLLSGTVASGQFPVDTVTVPVAAPLAYQTLVRMPLDGSAVLSSTLLAPGTQSFATADAAGGVWVDGALGAPLLPLAPLDEAGSIFAVHLTAPGATAPNTPDQTVRFGGLATANPTFASLPAVVTGVAVDAANDLLVAGAVQPTASSSLLATETYDLPLRNAPTPVFPSSVANAAQTAAGCTGSLCAGSAAYLAVVKPAAAPALSFAAGNLPSIVLRNLGSAAATGLQLTATGSGVSSTCPATLAAGAECNALLTGGTAGTLTAASAGDSQTLIYPSYAAASGIVFFPRELDFGTVTSTGPAGQRVITVSNLGTASQTFTSALASSTSAGSPFTEAASDCTLAGSATTKVLAPGGTCHITIAFKASQDAYQTADWTIGSRVAALTGFSQAAALSVSANEVDFGTQFASGLRLPRYLYLSNASPSAIGHTALALPAGSPFTLTDSCPATLIAGSVCRIRVDYLSPTVPSNDSAALALDGGLSVLLTGQTLPPKGVAGTAANPNLSVTPTAVSFATMVAVTSVGAETQTVTIRNTGTAPFPLTLALSGDFIDTTSCTSSLAGGATCAVVLSFAPSQPGARNGLLAVTAGAGTSPVYVSIAATGAAILPPNNGVLALGSAPVGQPIVKFYKIELPFSSLSAVASGPFSLAYVNDNGFTPQTPPASMFAQSVTANCADCYLAVEYVPTGVGPQTGTLTLSSASSGNPYVLGLTGSGLATSGLLLTPSTQDFGSIFVNSSSGAVLFTLTNADPAGAAAVLAAPTLTGDYAFVQMATGAQACSGSLAYGASCEVLVAAAPTATGTRPGSLSFSSATLSVTAALTVVGATDPGLAIRPLALTFNEVPGTAATQQNVTLTNTGAAALAIGAPTISSPFAVASTCATLAPGASCTLAVTFTPAAALSTGVLSIPAGGAIYSVALSGNYTTSNAGLEIIPALSEFGAEPVDMQSSPRVLTVNNLTAAQQTVDVQIPRQFVLLGAPCTTIAANGTCSFTVAFLPLTNGSISGSIVVQSGPSSVISYAEGYGVGGGTLTLTGGLIVNRTFNFGQVTSGQTCTQTFTATNSSATASLTVRRVTSQPPFAATTTCGGTLLPGATCTVTITYTPTNQVASGASNPSATNDAGTLVIESDALSSPDVLNLTGQAGPLSVANPASPTVVATYTLSEGSLSFAATTVGNSSAVQAITFTNTGTVTLSLLALGTTPDFTATSGCTSIVAGASCTIMVAATPQTAGTHIASLEILTNAATALEFVSLITSGNASPLVLAPASLDFGSAVVGVSSTLPVQVTNTGAAPIVFTSITASGDFAAGGSCPAPGGALASGASCTVQVTFTPTAVGTRPGTLSIATSASTLPRTVALTGIGIQSRLVVAPGSLAFGSLVLGASANLTVTLTNNGTAPVSSLSLTASGDFSVSRPCPTSLASGAACTAQITFTPTTLGARTGSIIVRSTDPSSPLTVPLTGTGITSGTFSLTVDGGASAAVTVKSGGPASYTLAVTPAGTFAGGVALTCAAVQAAPFASCSLAPATLTLAGSPQTAIATINTITSADGSAQLRKPLRPMTSRAEKLVCLLLPGASILYRRRRSFGRRLPVPLAVLLFAATLVVSGCGTQGGDFNTRYSPAGAYQYQVTATSTSGIQITQTVLLNLTVTPR